MIRMILNDLRAHPGRNLLTAASLFVGVIAVVAIIVGGSVVRDYLVAVAEQRDGRAPSYSATIDGANPLRVNQIASLISALPNNSTRSTSVEATSVSPITIARLSSNLSPLDFTRMDTHLVAGNLPQVKRLPMMSGRWLSSDDQTAPFEIVVNVDAERLLGGSGHKVALSGPADATASSATIVGVVNDGLTGQPTAYVKLTPIITYAPQIVTVNSVTVLWHGPSDTKQSVSAALSDVATDIGLKPPQEISRVDTVDDFIGPITGIQIAFAGAALLALIVAALGIINVGLASIRERSRELVIRRAVGATRGKIFGLIVGSALALSLVVAALAIGLSVAAVATIPSFLPKGSPINPPAYPLFAALAGAIAALSTAIIGSFIPGIKAARIEPATALRE